MADQPDLGDSPQESGHKRPDGAPSPHDAVFRRIFGVSANAASQLRAVLPPGITARLDLHQLARVPGSFVDEDLRWRQRQLGHLLRAVLGQPGGREEFSALLAYIVLVSETPAGELRDLAASLGPDAEEAS